MMRKRRFICLTVIFALMVTSLCVCFVFAGASGNATKTSENAETNELFTVSGNNSKVEKNYTYVAAEHQNPNILDAVGDPVVGAGSVTGVKVSLAQGDTFNYTKVIDLTGKTKDKPLFEFSIAPETIGKIEIEMFEISFTDAYDPTNVISICVVGAPDTHPSDYYRGPGLINGVGYLRAGVNGTYAAKDYFNGGVMRREEGEGAIIFLDFAGIGGASQAYPLINTIDTNVMSVFYNDETKEIFTHEKNEYWDKKRAVADLDDEEFFSEPWKGFRTGECFMSIKAYRYKESTFNFVLTEVDGQKVSEISEERKPHTITVDTLGFSESSLPNAVVGKSYPVFEAESVSPYYGRLNVDAEVYFGENKIDIENGRFLCAEKGEYTIVYTADDGRGTVVKKNLKVTAADEPDPIIVNIGTVETENFVAGDVVFVPGAAIYNTVGEITVKKYVIVNGKTTELDGDFYRIPVAGEYEFKVVCKDMLDRVGEAGFKIDAKAGTSAIFVDEVTMPKYFIGGRTYSLPTVYAYNYTDGSKDKVKTRIYATDENGEKVLPTGKITPAVGSGSVKISYDAELNGTHARKEFDIPVIDVRNKDGVIDIQKLFYVAEGSAEFTAGETDLTIKTNENTAIDYINPLASGGFEFKFCGSERFVSFDKVTLVLSDAENAAISVEFNYIREAGKTVFYVNNDGKRYQITENLYSSDDITLSYKQTDRTVSFSSGVKINAKITKTVAGEDFNGFTSGKVTARIILSGVYGGSKISIKQISNQMIGDMSFGEFANPVVFCRGDYGGSKKVGSTITLTKAYALDAIDAALDVSLSVFDADGNYITANDGTLLSSAKGDKSYDVTLAKCGSYRVYFTAKDLSGNSAGLSYIIEVVNEKEPEIGLSGAVSETVSAGETINLPSATAKTASGSADVQIYVMTEQGRLLAVKNGKFTFKNAGKYKVFYMCTDDGGNTAIKEFTVTAA